MHAFMLSPSCSDLIRIAKVYKTKKIPAALLPVFPQEGHSGSFHSG